MSEIRVRFAPSPTGLLHVGGARTALFNWLFARREGGRFILRVEDTDEQRNTTEANEAIFTGLRWLGLDWDEGPDVGGDRGPYRQSERQSIYDDYFARLEARGLVYEDEGAMRFRGPNSDRVIADRICGETVFADRDDPDMTIRRASGSYIFHFVSVVDDIEMGMSHVVRGEDHLPNTPRHLDLYEAFDATPPVFAHIPLILNPNGSKMSKRDEGASVQDYMDAGYHPGAVVNYLSLLGWSPKDDQELFLERDDLVQAFTLENVNRANARFDLEKCKWLSGQHIAVQEPGAVRESAAPFLEKAGLPADEAHLTGPILLELREKIRTYAEVPDWVAFLSRDDYEVDADAFEKMAQRDGIGSILQALVDGFSGAGSWDGETLSAAIASAAKSLEVKKGALMFPCRVAVSGQAGGLGLLTILEQLGQDRTVQRIKNALDKV